MSEYHEPAEELDDRTRDFHRALTSLKEEIEAVDWYGQRVQRAADPELRRVLDHNRKEEIEHACMTLEWLRRRAPEWDEALRTYLFQQGDIVAIEHREEAHEAGVNSGCERPGSRARGAGGYSSTGRANGAAGSDRGRGLGVGSLREVGR